MRRLSLATCLAAIWAGFLHPALAVSEVELLNPQSPTNMPFSSGGAAAAINDTFTYNPIGDDYTDPSFLNSAQQGIDLPITTYGSNPQAIFMSFRDGDQNIGTDSTNFLTVDVNLNTGQTLDFLDIWGRTDYSGAEEDRHQNLEIRFYDESGGSSGSGALLGYVTDFDGVTAKDGANTPGSAFGRLEVASILNMTQRSEVASVEIDHVGSSTFLLLAEIRAASLGGIGPGANPVIDIDRTTGEIVLTNESADHSNFTFNAYSLRSANGEAAFVPQRWNSITDTGDRDSGGLIDGDDTWFKFTAPGSAMDLSESVSPAGNGVTLAANESISLGRAFRRNSIVEGLSAQLINEQDQIVNVMTRFHGTFQPGDFDFDQQVTPADLHLWESAFGIDFTADTDEDSDSDGSDFLAWQRYQSSTMISAHATQIPEPTSAMSLLVSTIFIIGCMYRTRIAEQHTCGSCCREVHLLTLQSLDATKPCVLRCIAVFLAAALFSVQVADSQTITPVGNQIVRLEKLVDGISGDLSGNTANTRRQYIPIDMTPLGDGRQLILTLSGHVRLLNANGTIVSGAYLDTTNSRTPSPNAQDFTQIGATSIAAHPGFGDPLSRGYGKFYTITSEIANSDVTADFSLNLSEGGNYAVDSVVNEWTIDPLAINSADQLTYTPDTGSLADTVSVREVLRSQRPGIIHTLADMAFDSNENLLITSGDGGGTAFPNTDGSANGQDRATNSQDPANIFGSILRIDPLSLPGDTRQTGGANNQYRIPADNFFAIDSDPNTRSEFFAYGLRSPYRMSVDRTTGEIFLGDVGEASREEINKIVNGGNYGWGAFEGTRTADTDLAAEATNPIDPLFELYHNISGQSEAVNVVGGFVYRGTAIPELHGMYVFADTGENEFTQPSNVLELYYGNPDSTATSTRDDFYQLQLELPDGLPDRIWSLAEDENGELYALVGPERIDLFNVTEGETDGGIWRILPALSPPLNGIEGDVNQDGIVSGDGTGLAAADDVAAFVAGWLSADHGTAYAQYTNGDLNLDGITDLDDWLILKRNHPAISTLSLGAVLANRVPEFSSITGLLLALGFAPSFRTWRQNYR